MKAVIDFEKLYGPIELLKAISSVQNEILVEKGIATIEELQSGLQARLTKLIETKRNLKDRTSDAIAEMEKCVKCLAIELPGPVHDDVQRIWNNLKKEIQS